MKYAVNMTISPEIAQCNTRMRPFEKKGVTGVAMHPVLSIDVAIKHVSLQYLSAPLGKRTAIDHASGSVLIGLPSDISGYHAHSILLSGRGLQMLSRVAYEADFKAEGVCVESPKCYAGYLYDLWACLQDHLVAEITLDASELLLKELRLKVVSQTGRNVTRFEHIANAKAGHLSLYDTDTGVAIDTDIAVTEAIAYRVKKAAVNLINIEGLEARLFEIYRYCKGETSTLSIERYVDRPMPSDVSYTYFTYAITDAALSFEIAEKGAVMFGDVSSKTLATAEEIMAECLVVDESCDVQEDAEAAEDVHYVAAAPIPEGPVIVEKVVPTVHRARGRQALYRGAAFKGNSSSLHLGRRRSEPADTSNKSAQLLPGTAPSSPMPMTLAAIRTQHSGEGSLAMSAAMRKERSGLLPATHGVQLELFDTGKINDQCAQVSKRRQRQRIYGRSKSGPNRMHGASRQGLRATPMAGCSKKGAWGGTAPSPSAKIQTVHNLCYLQFESRKSGRVAPCQASLYFA